MDFPGAVCFSPDSRRLAACDPDATRVWDIDSGQELLWVPSGTEGAFEGWSQIQYSPNGQHLAVGCSPRNPSTTPSGVKILDAATGRELLFCPGPPQGRYPLRLCYSPAGDRLAAVHFIPLQDNQVTVWDTSTGRELLAFRAGSPTTNDGVALAFSPDGQRLATSRRIGGETQVWDVRTGRELGTFKESRGGSQAVAFSPDGERLASVGSEKSAPIVTIRDVRSSRNLFTFGGGKILDASPDGRHLAGALLAGWQMGPQVFQNVQRLIQGEVQVCDARTGLPLWSGKTHTGEVLSARYSGDGRLLASASATVTDNYTKFSDGEVKVWEALSGRELSSFRPARGVSSGIAFRSDGQAIAGGSDEGTLRVWDTKGNQLLAWKGHASRVTDMVYSPGNRHLATGSVDGTIKIWEAATGHELAVCSAHTGEVLRVVFSPDGETLASAGRDQNVRLWKARTGEELFVLRGHVSWVTAVCFSSDGRRLLSAAYNRDPNTARDVPAEIKVWETRTGQQLLSFAALDVGASSLFFLPESRRLVGAWQAVKLWDAQDEQPETLTLQGHVSPVGSFAFSPDGPFLASTHQDGSARVWSLRSGQEVFTLREPGETFQAAGYSADGKRLLLSSTPRTPGGNPVPAPGRLRAWEVATQTEIVPCTDPPPAAQPGEVLSPDGQFRAVLKGGSLRLHRTADLTADAVEKRQQAEALTSLQSHLQDAAACEANKEWPGAELHLNAALAAERQNALLHLRRGVVRRERGRNQEADVDIAAAVRLDPTCAPALAWQARLCLEAGDRIGYRKACASLVALPCHANDRGHYGLVAGTCLLGPEAGVDLKPLLEPMEKAFTGWKFDPNSSLWRPSTELRLAGGLLLRVGRAREAVERLQLAIQVRYEVTIQDELLLALAYHQLGQDAEAHQWLDQARLWLDRPRLTTQVSRILAAGSTGTLSTVLTACLVPDLPDSRTRRLGAETWLDVQLLLLEAESALRAARP